MLRFNFERELLKAVLSTIRLSGLTLHISSFNNMIICKAIIQQYEETPNELLMIQMTEI
jgi:hypothetical protein